MQSNQREKKEQKSETLRSSSIARRNAVQILNPDSLLCDEVRAVRRNSQGGKRTNRPSPPASPVNPFPPLLPRILAPGVEAYFSVLATSWSQSGPSPSEEPAASDSWRNGPVGLTVCSENPRLAGGLSSVPSLPHLPPPRGAGRTHLPQEQCI